MNRISAVIITKNEEKNIGDCIESVKSLVDEIVVVDSFSTDRTREICESHGAKFIEREWEGYAATKNYANSLSSFDYVLSLDADERLSKELRESVRVFQRSGLSGAYKMNRLSNYCGKWIKHCGWFPDPKIRLFPKSAASWAGDHVHERLAIPKNLEIHRLDGLLYHYSYYSIEEHLRRIKRYSRLGALKLNEAGKKGGWFRGVAKGLGRFVSCYILRLGILDGYYGWIICRNTAYAIYLKYLYLNEIRKETSK